MAYDQLINRIRKRGTKVFVAFGGGKFSSCSRGHAPVPKVGFYKALKERKVPCRYVWEYNTSKLCSRCFTALPKGKKWRLKICPKPSCRRFWNRDVNAARNMRHVFIFMNSHNGERPEAFKPAKKEQKQESKKHKAVTEGRKSPQPKSRSMRRTLPQMQVRPQSKSSRHRTVQ